MMENDEGVKKPWSYKDWYARNAQVLSERRKQKYQDDPEYKNKVLGQNRQYRMRKALERGDDPSGVGSRERRPITQSVIVKGVNVVRQLLYIGSFAREIDRSVATIHQWERLGLLPRTPFFAEHRTKQERLYTIEMIGVVKNAIEARRGIVSQTDKTFAQDVIQGWKALGIDVE